MEESKNDLLTSCKHNGLFHSYLYPKSRFSGCDVHWLVCGSDQCKQSRCKEDFGSGGHLHTQSINHLITPASRPTMSFSSKDSCSFGFSSPPPLQNIENCFTAALGMGRRNIFRHRVYIALLAKCQWDRQTCNGAFHRVETLDVVPDNKSNN